RRGVSTFARVVATARRYTVAAGTVAIGKLGKNTMKRLWVSACALALVLATGGIAGCTNGGTSSGTSAATTPSGSGKIKITYDDAGVKPENLEAYRIVKQSGGLDRLALWVNDRIALPRDITVKVTDAVPKGVFVASFDDLEGATVWEPAAFFTDSYQGAKKLVPEVKAADKVPSVLSDAEFTPEAVLSGTMEFIFGHEIGHAL